MKEFFTAHPVEEPILDGETKAEEALPVGLKEIMMQGTRHFYQQRAILREDIALFQDRVLNQLIKPSQRHKLAELPIAQAVQAVFQRMDQSLVKIEDMYEQYYSSVLKNAEKRFNQSAIQAVEAYVNLIENTYLKVELLLERFYEHLGDLESLDEYAPEKGEAESGEKAADYPRFFPQEILTVLNTVRRGEAAGLAVREKELYWLEEASTDEQAELWDAQNWLYQTGTLLQLSLLIDDLEHSREVGEKRQAGQLKQKTGIADPKQLAFSMGEQLDRELYLNPLSRKDAATLQTVMALMNNPDPDLSNLGLRILQNHHYSLGVGMMDSLVVRALIEKGDPEQKALGLNLAQEGMEFALANSYESDDYRLSWVDMAELLVEYSEEEQGPGYRYLKECVEQRGLTYTITAALARLCVCNKAAAQFQAFALLDIQLQKHDIRVADFARAWAISSKEPKEAFYDNINTIIYLENQAPGITQYLHRERGIADFARYPSELLLKQFAEREDSDRPYGVILMPRADWNGAFYDANVALAGLQAQIKDKFSVRVIECASKREIARQLLSLTKQYGKISFAIVGGHGSAISIQFGNGDGSGRLRISDFKDKGVQRLGEFFRPNAEISLISCSTGVRRGIGQRLSRLTQSRLTAPTKGANIKRYTVTFTEDSLRFDPEYTHDADTVSFTQGKKDG